MTDSSEIIGLQCAPAAVNVPKSDISRKSPPRKRSNAESGRPREHLEPGEVEKLRVAARKTRNPVRDEALVLLAFRHGFRVSELVALTWAQVHLDTRLLDVKRVKSGKPSTHDMLPDEIRLLKALRREGTGRGPVFVSERDLPIADSTVKKLVAKLGRAAGLPFPVHVHQLRHACGYYLVNEGMPLPLLQRWLGHVNVQHTIYYAELSPEAFKSWRAEWKRARRHR
jgi:type 1 fimbriae regulatory protein FimE